MLVHFLDDANLYMIANNALEAGQTYERNCQSHRVTRHIHQTFTVLRVWDRVSNKHIGWIGGY